MRDTKKTEDAGKRRERRIRRLETARMWLLILAALLIVGGYASAFLPVMFASVLPLGGMIVLTMILKRLERETDDELF